VCFLLILFSINGDQIKEFSFGKSQSPDFDRFMHPSLPPNKRNAFLMPSVYRHRMDFE
jgi:hypothetical protein